MKNILAGIGFAIATVLAAPLAVAQELPAAEQTYKEIEATLGIVPSLS
ncbi:MAG: carboxymuconolactone decarboxylase family protein, partial [Mesorhizobium sp.]